MTRYTEEAEKELAKHGIRPHDGSYITGTLYDMRFHSDEHIAMILLQYLIKQGWKIRDYGLVDLRLWVHPIINNSLKETVLKYFERR